MKHTEATPSTLADLMREEIDNMAIDNIVEAANTCVAFERNFESDETFNTNSSLMVYTSSVDRTNIEDRTMSTKAKLNEVHEEINALEDQLEKDVRKVGSTLITANLSSYRSAPQVKAEIFTPEWDRERRIQDEYIKAVRHGDISKEVEVSLLPLGGISKEVHLTSELMDTIDEYVDYVEEEYAYKMQKLLKKRYSLQQMLEAERNL